MNKVKFTLLAAGLVLAMALTFSCSSGDDDLPCLSCGDSGGYGDKGNDIANYRTVVIGTQTWMAENLNYAVAGSRCYGEGAEVVIDFDDNGSPISTKKLSSAEVQANCVKYGRLYDWATAMALPSSCNENSCSNQIQPKHRGICPSGWHIPSNNDWDKLFRYVDIENGGYGEERHYPYDSYTAGGYLKAANGWSNNGNGTDQYGFSALPGGDGYDGITFLGEGYVNRFSGVGSYGSWWSASEYGYESAYSRYFSYDKNTSLILSFYKLSLLSVRCVQDDETDPVGNQSSSSVWLSSSSYRPPPVLGDPNISITDTTFRWATDRQDEVLINVSVALTAVGGDLDTNIRGFDSVLVKLNGKLLNNNKGKEQFAFSYNRMFDPLISVEDELGLGVCGGDVVLTVEVYAFGNKNPQMRVSKMLRKDSNVGNCRSSSSATPSSSSAFVSKPLIPITFSSCPPSDVGEGCLMRDGQGINLAEEKGGVTGASDLSISWATRTIRTGGNIYSITEEFLSNAETGDCVTRGVARQTENTGPDYYPCPTATVVTVIDGTRGRKYLVKTNAAKDATDWVPGWYLIVYEGDDLGSSSTGMLIKAWKVN